MVQFHMHHMWKTICVANCVEYMVLFRWNISHLSSH
jgi:hypothetical protein